MLDVLNFTGPTRPASLNRQLMLLLSSLGVPDSYFLNLVDHQTVFKGNIKNSKRNIFINLKKQC